MKENHIKQISISFENKQVDQQLAKFLKKQKDTIGVSNYIKKVLMKDFEEKIKEGKVDVNDLIK
jgi:hypothetical protein